MSSHFTSSHFSSAHYASSHYGRIGEIIKKIGGGVDDDLLDQLLEEDEVVLALMTALMHRFNSWR